MQNSCFLCSFVLFLCIMTLFLCDIFKVSRLNLQMVSMLFFMYFFSIVNERQNYA